MKNFILQAIAETDHATAVNGLLADDQAHDFIISTAFMTETGISLIEEALKKVAQSTKIFVGVRNGITTAQSLYAALELGCSVYAVDTGTRQRIFHPKLYFAQSQKTAEIIVGSANLTVGGLSGNIEASLHETLHISDDRDKAFIEQVQQRFASLVKEYPDHVTLINSEKIIEELIESGRVVDEDKSTAPHISSRSSSREADQISRMRLNAILRPRRSKRKLALSPKTTQPKTITGKRLGQGVNGLELLWTSKDLTRRDLNIPTSAKTNPTGSMGWNKGLSDINQRTYFRTEIFDNLSWEPNPKINGKELAKADFQFIIRGIDYGVHRLEVTHDNRTDTTSYRQNNAMSELRWGEAKALVAREDLLERTLRLYQDPEIEDLFIIDID